MVFTWGIFALQRFILLCGCTVCHSSLLEKLVADGCFNLEHKPNGDYSHSTAILLVFTPDAQLKDIESMGIGLVVHWCGAPLAPISAVE